MNYKIISYLNIIIGNALLVFAINFFILPYNILSGGLAGIVNIINDLFFIDKVLLLNLLNLSFFILGSLFLGKEFAFKTVVCAITYPIFLSLISKINYSFFCSNITASIIGGIISGVGIGIVFKNNGSTGGTDALILVLHKYTGLSISKLGIIIDGLIACFGLAIAGLDEFIIGLLSILMANIVIQQILKPKTSSSCALFIISNNSSIINLYIHDVLKRGSTVINALGGYKNDPKKILFVIISQKQYPKIIEYINRIDSKAFVFASNSKEVFGEGFTYNYRM